MFGFDLKPNGKKNKNNLRTGEIKVKAEETVKFVVGEVEAEKKREDIIGRFLGLFVWLVSEKDYKKTSACVEELKKAPRSMIEKMDIAFEIDNTDEKLKEIMKGAVKSLREFVDHTYKLWGMKQSNISVPDVEFSVFEYKQDAAFQDLKQVKTKVLEACVAAYSPGVPFHIERTIKNLKADVNESAVTKDTTEIGIILSKESAPNALEKLKVKWVDGVDNPIMLSNNVTEVNIKTMEKALFLIKQIIDLLELYK